MPKKIKGLRLDEISGVRAGAAGVDGWLTLKSAPDVLDTVQAIRKDLAGALGAMEPLKEFLNEYATDTEDGKQLFAAFELLNNWLVSLQGQDETNKSRGEEGMDDMTLRDAAYEVFEAGVNEIAKAERISKAQATVAYLKTDEGRLLYNSGYTHPIHANEPLSKVRSLVAKSGDDGLAEVLKLIA